MYTYKTLNGKTLAAPTLRGVAVALWEMKMDPEPTLEAWMEGSAKRALAWNGSVVPVDTPEAHIAGLVAAGILVDV